MACVRGDQGGDGWVWGDGAAVLKREEGGGPFGREEVGEGREMLPEFDEDGAVERKDGERALC
jgi:hypothetical protein